ncbi:hypothetical protein [Pseudobacteriovorax antillogorgiicola]|uniref:Secreted protein n=1 Tax=Pseudobacteriovorax antillogorgiicola TaxID=1513793 RepID=A0A1Y6CQF2_9BACT|nr:hypothetical protein [Pseudobacteriovorax antillogorgiicola]TCS43484.1 hypothetical protein EDD56_13612 [Pseudobacteriovorax antillogorgiicola]SMF81242.1 hypothetical protein SAMN06296036_13634 [Pseudobacteriovorax antillogorgiicola]
MLYKLLFLLVLASSCQSTSRDPFARHTVEDLDEKYQSDHAYCRKHRATRGFRRCMVLNGWHPGEVRYKQPRRGSKQSF